MRIHLFVALALLAAHCINCYGDGPVSVAASYAPMSFEDAKERTVRWASEFATEAQPAEALERIWDDVERSRSGRDLHDVVVQSFAAVDPMTAEFLATLDPLSPPLVAPEPDEVLGSSDDPFFRTNLSMYVGRFLADAKLYEEAIEFFDEGDLSLAVDPATALFYRSVCEHQLLMKEEGLASLRKLLDESHAVPDSYIVVGRLMLAELNALEDDSLDEIAGLMRDVERRLTLARGGQRVQKKEEAITAKLDEMIKKIEEQMSQSSNSSGGGSGGQNQSSNPLGDSIVKGSTAPGEVDEKDVRRAGGWGDLPPREREQAKNEIEKAFPSNYSRLINEYFLKRTQTSRANPAGR